MDIETWHEKIKSICKEDTIIYLCGNKSDLGDERYVRTEEMQKKQKLLKIDGCIETSALNGSNLEELFKSVVSQIKEVKPEIFEQKNIEE